MIEDGCDLTGREVATPEVTVTATVAVLVGSWVEATVMVVVPTLTPVMAAPTPLERRLTVAMVSSAEVKVAVRSPPLGETTVAMMLVVTPSSTVTDVRLTLTEMPLSVTVEVVVSWTEDPVVELAELVELVGF